MRSAIIKRTKKKKSMRKFTTIPITICDKNLRNYLTAGSLDYWSSWFSRILVKILMRINILFEYLRNLIITGRQARLLEQQLINATTQQQNERRIVHFSINIDVLRTCAEIEFVDYKPFTFDFTEEKISAHRRVKIPWK